MQRDRSPKVEVCPAYVALGDVERPDARAIEVIAMVEEDVVCVRHLVVGAPPPAAWRPAAIVAAVAIACAVAIGAIALRAAARGERLPVVLDPVAAFVLLAAVVASAIALGRRADARAAPRFELGADADFPLPCTADGSGTVAVPVSLVEVTPEPVLTVPAGGRVTAWPEAGQPESHAGPLRTRVAVGVRYTVDLGVARFLITSVAAPKRHAAPLLELGPGLRSFAGGSAALHAILLGILFLVPPSAAVLTGDTLGASRFSLPTRTIPFNVVEILRQQGGDRGTPPGDKSGPAAAGGRAGAGRPGPVGGSPGKSPPWRSARPVPSYDPRSAGILGLMQRQEGTNLGSLFRRGSALGNDAQAALDGMGGTTRADGLGDGGDAFGAKGPLPTAGPGRGGKGFDLGEFSTGQKGGRGGPRVAWGERTTVGPEILAEPPIVHPGGLDRDLIRRTIRKHLNEVKFCFERAVERDRSIDHGRVVVEFTILASGRVASARAAQSSFPSSDVGGCIAGAVQRWDFPTSHGVSIVSYPFRLALSE